MTFEVLSQTVTKIGWEDANLSETVCNTRKRKNSTVSCTTNVVRPFLIFLKTTILCKRQWKIVRKWRLSFLIFCNRQWKRQNWYKFCRFHVFVISCYEISADGFFSLGGWFWKLRKRQCMGCRLQKNHFIEITFNRIFEL